MKFLLITIAIGISSISGITSPLPPPELRGSWAELEKLRYGDWRIGQFDGWDTAFDGGSKVFFFKAADGRRFDVMAANPGYWTGSDKRNQKQVFFVIHKNRFYRLEAGSKHEKKLITMIEAARPKLSGTGTKDPKLLDGLVERIRSRKPMFESKLQKLPSKPAAPTPEAGAGNK